MAESPEQQLKRILLRGRKDPVWFVENVLASPLWDAQREILDAIWKYDRVAVRAAHSVGKTYTAARAALTFLSVYPGSRVLTTAPTFAQVQRLLWSEISSAYGKSKIPLGGELLNTELRMGPNWFAVGLSTDSPDRFQGHHAEHILIILDEATGIDANIWLAAEANRAGGNAKILAIGNPTRPSGPFYDCFTRSRDLWHCLSISAFDSPNLAKYPTPRHLREADEEDLKRNPFPGLTSRQWVMDRLHEWGEDSPLFQSRVLGAFPDHSDDAVITLDAAERAAELWDKNRDLKVSPPSKEDPWIAGLDLAGPGKDETVLIIRRGNRVAEMLSTTQPDPRGWVLQKLLKYAPYLIVYADEVGLGYHAVSHIRDQGIKVIGVNVGKAPSAPKRFFNLRAELLWGLREKFDKGEVEIPRDEQLISQLTSLKYNITPRGQIAMETKTSMQKRGVKSPDKADALYLCFAQSPKLKIRHRSRSKSPGVIA